MVTFNLEGRKGEIQLVDPKSLAIDVLQALSRADSRIDAIVQILEHLKTHLGVSATAIRLNENGDYPYFLFDGFSDTHIEMEDRLCTYDRDGEIFLDEDGKPVLECMCGQVIKGTAPRDKDYITEYGTFWSNNTDELLANTSVEELEDTRNVCNAQGYLSVALIPLKTKEGTVGLLQINDEHPDKFTEDLIWFLEGLAESIGIALAHLTEENKRKELEREQRTLLYQYKLRINQLDCLYKISKIQENRDISTDEMLGLIVSLIPGAMQQPDVAVARMDIEDRKYESAEFVDTPYRYSAIIQSYGVIMGKLSVGYVVKTPKEYRGPFLEEEVKLINLIAETVSRLLEQEKAGDWNKSIDKYALILANDEISHIMKLIVEDIAISSLDREEYDIRDVPQDSSQTFESYMQLQHNIEVNQAIIRKLQKLLNVH